MEGDVALGMQGIGLRSTLSETVNETVVSGKPYKFHNLLAYK